MICVTFTAFCDLRMSVRKFWFCKTCVDLRLLASPFGQGFIRDSTRLKSVAYAEQVCQLSNSYLPGRILG